MVRTLEEMVSTGRGKMERKATTMKSNYEAAKGDMKSHYDALPFGPTMKANYKAGIDTAQYRVDADKWARNWRARVTR